MKDATITRSIDQLHRAMDYYTAVAEGLPEKDGYYLCSVYWSVGPVIPAKGEAKAYATAIEPVLFVGGVWNIVKGCAVTHWTELPPGPFGPRHPPTS